MREAFPVGRADFLVKREDDAHIVPLGGKRLGQRARNIRKAAGFHKGHAFGGGEQNAWFFTPLFHGGHMVLPLRMMMGKLS